VFVIYELSIFLFFPRDGGDFSMIPTIHGWLFYFTTTIKDDSLMICTILYSVMSPLFGEEFSRLTRLLSPVLKS